MSEEKKVIQLDAEFLKTELKRLQIEKVNKVQSFNNEMNCINGAIQQTESYLEKLTQCQQIREELSDKIEQVEELIDKLPAEIKPNEEVK